MTITVERTSVRDERWARFVEERADATIFHHPDWATLLGEVYGFESFAIVAIEDGAVVAGAPFLRIGGGPLRRRWCSLPFTDRCAPLGDEYAVRELVSGLAGLAARHGIASIEVRDAGTRSHGAADVGVRHTIPLDSERTALGRVAPAHLRNARRAEREGVSFVIGNTADEMREFYELHVRTRRRLGVPVQPERFFTALQRALIAPGRGFLATARRDGRAIASAVFLRSGRTLMYKYGASDERYWSLRPNDLLFREAISLACLGGYAGIDLGRSDREDAGLRRFKSELGGVEVPLAYTRIGPWPEVRRLGGILSGVIRHSSPIVCRALGSALYRYSA